MEFGEIFSEIFEEKPFSFVLLSAYRGNLVAFMTHPGMQPAFDNPVKVLDSKIPITMFNYGGGTTIAFNSMTNPLYKRIFREKSWIPTFEEAYEEVAKGKMIFMDHRFILELATKAGYMDKLGRPLMFLATYGLYRYGPTLL